MSLQDQGRLAPFVQTEPSLPREMLPVVHVILVAPLVMKPQPRV